MIVLRVLAAIAIAAFCAFYGFWIGAMLIAAIIVVPIGFAVGPDAIRSVFQPVEGILNAISLVGGVIAGIIVFIFIYRRLMSDA